MFVFSAAAVLDTELSGIATHSPPHVRRPDAANRAYEHPPSRTAAHGKATLDDAGSSCGTERYRRADAAERPRRRGEQLSATTTCLESGSTSHHCGHGSPIPVNRQAHTVQARK